MHIIQALGGLGIFLLGMIIMTDRLGSLAGDALRKLLLRFTPIVRRRYRHYCNSSSVVIECYNHICN